MHFVLKPKFPFLYPMGVKLAQLLHHIMELHKMIFVQCSPHGCLFHDKLQKSFVPKVCWLSQLGAEMPDVSTRQEQLQDFHPSTVFLIVSMSAVTFCSISFVPLCKVEKSDRQPLIAPSVKGR